MLTVNYCNDNKFRITRTRRGGNGGPPTQQIVGLAHDTELAARKQASAELRAGERISPALGSYNYHQPPPPPIAPPKGKASDLIAWAKANPDEASLKALKLSEEAEHPAKSETDSPGRSSVIKAINKLLGA